MKKIIALLLVLGICIAGFSSCSKVPAATPETTTQPAEQTHTPTWSSGPEALQGKKIIFIGNSYTFWGQTVLCVGTDVLAQEDRSNDKGYFYQLCKAKGIEVSVTNWTFGGHDIPEMFGGPCEKGDDNCLGEHHEYYIRDRYYDYVCIQPYREKAYKGDIIEHLKYTMDFFRKANPNVCFLLLVPQMAPEKGYAWLQDVEALKSENVRICNWGGMLQSHTQYRRPSSAKNKYIIS